ncbi:MAG TPA: hypothetical protein VNS32_23275, partial [Flavisolibacter sp.]|nr:hypothetical protein [Flavisolibacter sp.]
LLLAFIVETHLAGFQTALSVLLYLMLLLVQGILTFKLTIYLLKDIVPQLIAENGKMKAFLKLLVVLAAVTALWWAVSNLIIDHFLLDIDKSGLFGINNIVRIFYVLFSTAIIIVLPLVILVLFLLFLSLIAINALIWNVLKAPIRSLYEHEVIRKGKLFAILGIAMIALSFPALKNVSIIEKIIGAFF